MNSKLFADVVARQRIRRGSDHPLRLARLEQRYGVGRHVDHPVSGTVEVDHHVFHIKAGSLAAQALHGFSQGQKVELVLDGPPAGKATQVLKISAHEAQVSHEAQ